LAPAGRIARTRLSAPENERQSIRDERRGAGGRRPAANATVMLRPLLGISEPDLERQLLRKGVVRLAAGRAHCHDCGRTPLVGERVHLFDDGDLVCELCRPRRDGAPERSEAVHHSERGQTVKRRAA
jgi:hypothetical protein